MTMVGWIILTMLACVGLVQLLSWGILASGRKWRQERRVFLVTEADWWRQLGALYTAVQWTPDADPRKWVLLDDTAPGSQAEQDCKALAQEVGMIYSRFPLEERLLRGVDLKEQDDPEESD